MALTQEEIRIRAGLDYSRVTAGLTSIRGQVHKLAMDVPKKLSSLLKANVYMAAGDVISKMTEKATEAWLSFYGENPEIQKAKLRAAQEIQDFSKKTIAEFVKAQEGYAAVVKKFQEGGMNGEEKFSALRKESDAIRDQIKTKEAQMKGVILAREGYRPGQPGFSYDESNKLAIEQRQIQSDILNLKTKMLAVDASAAELNLKNMRAIGNRYWRGQSKIQEDRTAAISGIQNAANSVESIPFIGGTIAAALAAQAEAMRKIPQPVRIVEVE